MLFNLNVFICILFYFIFFFKLDTLPDTISEELVSPPGIKPEFLHSLGDYVNVCAVKPPGFLAAGQNVADICELSTSSGSSQLETCDRQDSNISKVPFTLLSTI